MNSKTNRLFDSNPKYLYFLAILLFGWNLWGYDLWAPNEPFFGEGAREMIVDGHWLVPYVNGEVNTHKPPLFFWLIALFSLPFGEVLSITARLPSLLAALGTIALTLRLGRVVFGQSTAFVGCIVLITSHMFWEKARMAQIDSLLCFLILGALSAFEAFRTQDMSGRRMGLVFWTCCALAVLAKGPVGVLIPLGIVLITLACERRIDRWRNFAPILGPFTFASLLGLWVIATWWEPNYSVIDALREHFVDRAIHGMHHPQPFWYYARALPYTFLPWSLLIPGAALLAWKQRSNPRQLLISIAPVFTILFFSISTEKRDLYIVPAFPFIALLCGRLLTAVFDQPKPTTSTVSASWVRIPQIVTGGLLIVGSMLAIKVAPRYGEALATPAVLLSSVLAIGGITIIVLASRQHLGRAFQATAVTMASGMLVAVTFVYPALEPIKSGRILAQQIRNSPVGTSSAHQPILGFELETVPDTINFYSDGIYFDLVEVDELVAQINRASEPLYVLANQEEMPELTVAQQDRMTTLYSIRLARKDLLFLRFDPVG